MVTSRKFFIIAWALVYLFTKWSANSIFSLIKKFKKRFYFFTCILPDYVALDITKVF